MTTRIQALIQKLRTEISCLIDNRRVVHEFDFNELTLFHCVAGQDQFIVACTQSNNCNKKICEQETLEFRFSKYSGVPSEFLSIIESLIEDEIAITARIVDGEFRVVFSRNYAEDIIQFQSQKATITRRKYTLEDSERRLNNLSLASSKFALENGEIATKLSNALTAISETIAWRINNLNTRIAMNQESIELSMRLKELLELQHELSIMNVMHTDATNERN